MVTPPSPEPNLTPSFWCGHTWEEDESKHPATSSNLPPEHPSTWWNVPTTVAIFDSCPFSNHEPMMTTQPLLATPSDSSTYATLHSFAPPPQYINLAALTANIHAIPLNYPSPHSNQDDIMMTKPTAMMNMTDDKGISAPPAPMESLPLTSTTTSQHNPLLMTMMMMTFWWWQWQWWWQWHCHCQFCWHQPLTPTHSNNPILSNLDTHLLKHSTINNANNHDDDFLMMMTMTTMMMKMMTILPIPLPPTCSNNLIPDGLKTSTTCNSSEPATH